MKTLDRKVVPMIAVTIASLLSVVGSASAVTIPRPIPPIIKGCTCMGRYVPPKICPMIHCPEEFTLAKKEPDEGRSLGARVRDMVRDMGGVANPVGSQPAPGEDGEAFRRRTGRSDGRSPAEVGPARGAGGRDAGQRERNQESGHRGHGGPQ
jgi:hypothetical protein